MKSRIQSTLPWYNLCKETYVKRHLTHGLSDEDVADLR
jgi:hypothetical protein